MVKTPKFQVAGWYAIGKIKQYAKLIIDSITKKFDHWPCIISISIQLSNIILKLKNTVSKICYVRCKFILKLRKFELIFFFNLKKVDNLIANVKPQCFSYHFTYFTFILSFVKFQVADCYVIWKKTIHKINYWEHNSKIWSLILYNININTAE